ncbi:MAG: PorP/SprF family type IX secretion system membrane protein [Hellea sp.]|jgi:type IX secretion system PorP/SprF family membrane protein|nr:PorP/SprF family type IX secretion system membrane protein [Hellea sp.]
MRDRLILTALGILGSILLSLSVHAQNDSFVSYSIMNPTLHNPAWVGNDRMAHVILQVRSQWTGYKTSFDGKGGAPSSFVFNMSVPVTKKFSDIGVSLLNETIGPINNMGLNFPISYKIDINESKLILGLMPGIISRSQNFNELRFNDSRDPLNKIGTKEVQTLFNLALGALYSLPRNSYVGLSISNLMRPKFNYGLSGFSNKLLTNYTLMFGAFKSLTRELEFRPNLVVKTDLNTLTFDLGAQVQYNTRMWLGASYSWSEAFVVMGGYSLMEKNRLKLGFALDLVVQDSQAKNATSQEIYIRYDLLDFVIGGKKKIKTPRFIN